MDRWAGGCPCEDNESNWQARCSVEKPPETRFVLGDLVIGLAFTFLLIAFDCGEEGEPCDEISHQNRKEGKTYIDSCEPPLLVNDAE